MSNNSAATAGTNVPTTLARRSTKKRVSFSEAPHESRGVFLRELVSGNEGLSTKELQEILKLRAEAATSDWDRYPIPPHPLLDSPQGQLRYATQLTSQPPHSRVPSRPYPKTMSRIVDESQILTIINTLINYIKLSKTFKELIKNISFLVNKKRAINTLRVLYGIDLSKPDIQLLYDIDRVDIENIDSELTKHRKDIDALNDYYSDYAPQKYRENNPPALASAPAPNKHNGGTKKRINKKRGNKKSKLVKKGK